MSQAGGEQSPLPWLPGDDNDEITEYQPVFNDEYDDDDDPIVDDDDESLFADEFFADELFADDDDYERPYANISPLTLPPASITTPITKRRDCGDGFHTPPPQPSKKQKN